MHHDTSVVLDIRFPSFFYTYKKKSILIDVDGGTQRAEHPTMVTVVTA